jgi:predicted ATP-dependent serine protease
MTPRGLIDVDNPSELFISDSLVASDQEGAAVAVVMEGSRSAL